MLPESRWKSIKKCRHHPTIYLRQRAREQTHQVRVCIGKADLQEGCTYIQTDARIDPKHSRGCKVTDTLWQSRSVEPVRSCSFGKPRDFNCCCLWTKLPGWHRQLSRYRNYLQQNRSRHSHVLRTATRPTARDFTLSSSSSRYLHTRSPITDIGKKKIKRTKVCRSYDK